MKIYAISASAANRRNFKGIEKAAGEAAKTATGAAGKAFSNAGTAAGAANKAGAGQTGSKFLQTAFETVKYIGIKVFKGISRIIDGISNFIKGSKKADGAGFEAPKAPKATDAAAGGAAGKNIASDTTEAAIQAAEQGAQGVTARESTQEAAQAAAEQSTKVLPFPKKAEDAIEVLVGGQKYMFRPGKDKLPEGATIQNGVLMLDKETRKEAPMAAIQKIREAIELAKGWGLDEPPAMQPPTV